MSITHSLIGQTAVVDLPGACDFENPQSICTCVVPLLLQNPHVLQPQQQMIFQPMRSGTARQPSVVQTALLPVSKATLHQMGPPCQLCAHLATLALRHLLVMTLSWLATQIVSHAPACVSLCPILAPEQLMCTHCPLAKTFARLDSHSHVSQCFTMRGVAMVPVQLGSECIAGMACLWQQTPTAFHVLSY